jgi:hypothetical protein
MKFISILLFLMMMFLKMNAQNLSVTWKGKYIHLSAYNYNEPQISIFLNLIQEKPILITGFSKNISLFYDLQDTTLFSRRSL